MRARRRRERASVGPGSAAVGAADPEASTPNIEVVIMNKRRLVPILIASAGLLALGTVAAEYEREWTDDGGLPRLAEAQQAAYQRECGGCHLAYPPALLPAASWRALMDGLASHFGDNAELDPTAAPQIAALLVQNAADQAQGPYAKRARRATQGLAPILRITATDYFRGKHHEIPAKMVANNPKVASFSRCEACHTRAAAGSFDEDEVRIPGFGRFDD